MPCRLRGGDGRFGDLRNGEGSCAPLRVFPSTRRERDAAAVRDLSDADGIDEQRPCGFKV
jgi:hypothetical protein